MNRVLCAVGLAALCLMWAASAVAASTPAQRCEASKLKASGKKAACRIDAMAKAAIKGKAALDVCSKKFGRAFIKAEAKGGCATVSDATAVEGRIDAATDAIQAALSGTRFVDNGNGTVTDNQTGLQWEKKVADSECTHCVEGECAHCVGATYIWTNTGTAPDGSAFRLFLGALNNCVDNGSGGSPPTGVTGGFAGHCDWRLPTIVELQTIIDMEAPGCGSFNRPCIDPIFGPTSGSFYWSSTTIAGDQGFAWDVDFFVARVGNFYKARDSYVRAVRGGS